MRATNHAHARESATGARRSQGESSPLPASQPCWHPRNTATKQQATPHTATRPTLLPTRTQHTPCTRQPLPISRGRTRAATRLAIRPGGHTASARQMPRAGKSPAPLVRASSSCARAHAVGARGNRGRRVRLHLVGRGVGGEDRVTSDASGVAQRRECDTPPGCANSAGGRAHRLRGGVSGRLAPPKLNFCLSAGLRMRKEHMSDSSTDMTAPALSNSPQ
mmetsp:Transcript_27378/g.46917  ORF Transcript_27378/g.46917 Transcript_27378/m.46917 type:complete len:220 (-) Transcript_27378:710-1369(-)